MIAHPSIFNIRVANDSQPSIFDILGANHSLSTFDKSVRAQCDVNMLPGFSLHVFEQFYIYFFYGYETIIGRICVDVTLTTE